MIWMACPAGANVRKNGTASTAKPNPLVASSIAAKKLTAAMPAQSPTAITQRRSGPHAPSTASDGRQSQRNRLTKAAAKPSIELTAVTFDIRQGVCDEPAPRYAKNPWAAFDALPKCVENLPKRRVSGVARVDAA